jgi:glycosyltransferase EpsF
MKILHILGKFDRGGVEVFLIDLFLESGQDDEISFLSLDAQKGALDPILLDNGAVIYKIPLNQNFFKFCTQYYNLLKQQKDKFDVVHSHVQSFSGLLLFIAFLAGVKVRVSHSHSEETILKNDASFVRKLYLKITGLLLKKSANVKIACSEIAGKSLYGEQVFKVVVNGININKFKEYDVNFRQKVIREFGFSDNDKIVGHVGRFDIPKNQRFIIEIAEKVIAKDPSYKFVLVGDGILFNEIKNTVVEKGLQKNIILTGNRDDVPLLLTNLFDLFVFPSLFEGLPIVLLEAQICGLKCLISKNISKESIVFSEMVDTLELSSGSEYWSSKIFENINKSDKSGIYRKKFRDTKYSIKETLNHLNSIYKNSKSDK